MGNLIHIDRKRLDDILDESERYHLVKHGWSFVSVESMRGILQAATKNPTREQVNFHVSRSPDYGARPCVSILQQTE